MPLFHGQRDASLVHKFNTELIVDIIDTEVALYKLSLENTKTNINHRHSKAQSLDKTILRFVILDLFEKF
jgi:hypothetical protein